LRKVALQNGCTVATLMGSFSLASSGAFVTGGTSAGNFNNAASFQVMGRFTADGLGNLTSEAPSISSNVTGGSILGTYTVNSDCTGTATFIISEQ